MVYTTVPAKGLHSYNKPVKPDESLGPRLFRTIIKNIGVDNCLEFSSTFIEMNPGNTKLDEEVPGSMVVEASGIRQGCIWLARPCFQLPGSAERALG